MSAAFTLTMAYLAENCSVKEAGGAMAAYITGAVASNLIGRLLATAFLTQFGLSGSFFAFAALNFSGAVFVAVTLGGVQRKEGECNAGNHRSVESSSEQQTPSCVVCHRIYYSIRLCWRFYLRELRTGCAAFFFVASSARLCIFCFRSFNRDDADRWRFGEPLRAPKCLWTRLMRCCIRPRINFIDNSRHCTDWPRTNRDWLVSRASDRDKLYRCRRDCR